MYIVIIIIIIIIIVIVQYVKKAISKKVDHNIYNRGEDGEYDLKC